MLVALIALSAGWALTALAFLRAMTRQRREHGRREELLLARLCHLADRPWERAPADVWTPDEPIEVPVRTFASPEQWGP